MLGVDLTMPPAIVEQSSRSPLAGPSNVDAQRPEREQSERPVRCSSWLERSTTSGRCAFASLRSLRVATPVEPATPFHHKGDPASKNDGPDDGQDESSGQFAPRAVEEEDGGPQHPQNDRPTSAGPTASCNPCDDRVAHRKEADDAPSEIHPPRNRQDDR